MKPDWEKIKQIVKICGGTKELAAKLNESESTIRSWFARESIPLEKIPNLLGAINHMLSPADINPEYFSKINEAHLVSSNGDKVAEIPLLNEPNIGKSAPGTAHIYMEEAAKRNVSNNTFALIAASDIMAPSITKGDIVIIDPDLESQPGDTILAKLTNPNQHLIAKYKLQGYEEDGNIQVILSPSNSDYPEFNFVNNKSGKLIGPVIEHRRILK